MDSYVVCVRFVDKIDENEFVYVRDIKYDVKENFRPQNCDDFETRHQYKILWCLCESEFCSDDVNKQCQYYPGYIVCIAESQEEAENKSSTTRFRLPKKIFSPAELKTNSGPSVKQKSILQKQKSQVSLENLQRTKAIEKAKLKSSKEQLQMYANANFLNTRNSLNRSSVSNPLKVNNSNSDNEENVGVEHLLNENQNQDPLLTTDNGHSQLQQQQHHRELSPTFEPDDGILLGSPELGHRKRLFNDQPLPQEKENNRPGKIMHEHIGNQTNDENRIQEDGEILFGSPERGHRKRLFNDQPLPQEQENNRPEEIMHEHIGNQRNDENRRQGQYNCRPRRLFRIKNAPDVQNNPEDEQAVDLFKTPEAQNVDPIGKVKYQVDGDFIYLGEGKAVEKAFWDFLKIRGDNIFLRETAELICGKQHLVNRCIKKNKVSIHLQNRSPRKAITPRKYNCIRELFQDYLVEKQYDDVKQGRLLRRFNRNIGYKIKDLRKNLMEELPEN